MARKETLLDSQLKNPLPISLSDFEPKRSSDRVINSLIAQRIKNLLQDKRVKDSPHKTLLLLNDCLEPHKAAAVFQIDKQNGILPRDIPQEIDFPLYAISHDSLKFINDDNKTYKINIACLLNEKGQATNFIEVREFPPSFSFSVDVYRKIFPRISLNQALINVPQCRLLDRKSRLNAERWLLSTEIGETEKRYV
jgi:hypothetical protein